MDASRPLREMGWECVRQNPVWVLLSECGHRRREGYAAVCGCVCACSVTDVYVPTLMSGSECMWSSGCVCLTKTEYVKAGR